MQKKNGHRAKISSYGIANALRTTPLTQCLFFQPGDELDIAGARVVMDQLADGMRFRFVGLACFGKLIVNLLHRFTGLDQEACQRPAQRWGNSLRILFAQPPSCQTLVAVIFVRRPQIVTSSKHCLP